MQLTSFSPDAMQSAQSNLHKPTAGSFHMPLLIQVADVSTEGACVWVWHGLPDVIELVWEINGIPAGTQIFPKASRETGWTSTYLLRDLPSDSEISLTATCSATHEQACTRFSTPPSDTSGRPLRFGWGGDICGQGYGRHIEHGMPVFNALLEQDFDFFILCGDLIYADHDLPAERMEPPGNLWINQLENPLAEAIGLPQQSRYAVSADDFRSKYLYLWADAGFREFVTNTPMVYVLDDHEIYNNWTRATTLSSDSRYASGTQFSHVRDQGLRVWREYAPSRNAAHQGVAPGFKIVKYGPLLDVFVLDVRSQRAANSANLQSAYGPDSYWLGPAQLSLLITALTESTAVWKVIISGAPLSILVEDGDAAKSQTAQVGAVWDSVANGDHGVPAGREIELAMLLTALHQTRVDNLVVLSGDVHFASAVHYDPQRAAFHDFTPFCEFISGPLHAGGFPSKGVDRTFGAKQVFVKASPLPNTPPGDQCTSFGAIEIDPETGEFAVSLCDALGSPVFTQVLLPQHFSIPQFT